MVLLAAEPLTERSESVIEPLLAAIYCGERTLLAVVVFFGIVIVNDIVTDCAVVGAELFEEIGVVGVLPEVDVGRLLRALLPPPPPPHAGDER